MVSARVIIEINENGRIQSSFLEEKSLKTQGHFKPLHLPSLNHPEKQFEALDNLPVGTVVGGNLHVNFLIQENLAAFRNYLQNRKLRIKVSPQFIEKLTVYFKMRVTGLWNPQILDMNAPDFFLSDFMGELASEEEGEPTLPIALEEKLKELTEVRNDLMKEVDKLSSEPLTPEKIMAMCPEKHRKNIVNYHDFKQSSGNYRPGSFYINHDNQTIYYARQNPPYRDIDVKSHFKKELALEIKDYEELYDQYTATIFKETYKLLKLRNENIPYDEHKPEEFLNLNQIIFYVQTSIHQNSTIYQNNKDKKSFKLTQDHFRQYFSNILTSPEFEAINSKLKKSFDDIESIIEDDLLDPQNLFLLDNRIDKAAHAMLQGLNYRALPKKGDPCMSVSIFGFRPLLDDNGKVIPARIVTQQQINDEKTDLVELTDQFPAYSLHVAQLVQNNDQPEKIEEIVEHVVHLNKKARQYREKEYYLVPMQQSSAVNFEIKEAGKGTTEKYLNDKPLVLGKNAIEIDCDAEKICYRIMRLDGTQFMGFIFWTELNNEFPKTKDKILGNNKYCLSLILEITSRMGYEYNKPSLTEQTTLNVSPSPREKPLLSKMFPVNQNLNPAVETADTSYVAHQSSGNRFGLV